MITRNRRNLLSIPFNNILSTPQEANPQDKLIKTEIQNNDHKDKTKLHNQYQQ